MNTFLKYSFWIILNCHIYHSQLSREYELRIKEAGSDLVNPFRCEINKGEEILWRKDDNEVIFIGNTMISQDTRIRVKNDTSTDRSLSIRYLKSSDEGRYRCINRKTQAIISDYRLKLKAKPEIPIHSGDKVNVLEYGTTRLWCNATGIPQPTVTWYAMEVTNQQEEVLRDIGIRGNMLGIQNVSRFCATKFQCRATNNYKENKAAVHNITLNVKFLPDVKIKIRLNEGNFKVLSSFAGDRADKVELVCDVLANPLTTVTWYRDEIEIGRYSSGETKPKRNDKESNNYVYELSNIQINRREPRFLSFPLKFTLDAKYTFSSYRCIVMNELGSVEDSVNVVPKQN
ncbi:hemicentin-1-like [Saccostrea echinata]|uniref:hemicentin-1-like n=1 Tax=Saccostrea echinata TaxID=191078 RepID=UPI002A825709|nr:hemicentin-1-like [Saccostrea echinata]